MAELEDELKSAVYLSVAKMVEQYVKELDTVASPSFVVSLVELVYNQVVLMGDDLEVFAHHAGRTTIDTSDVYLATRRNDALTAALRSVQESLGELLVQEPND
ncbi:hypothetical protein METBISCDRAFT_20967 [Metschnikowia bicuspidata]|uniref:Uncharacterized protein n=1 Tax=Metschnikowia bicuspidata TaxID=27322 RepID=A0A4P9ZHQ2_9ASCO|nr:hypothetical protein METBISCDRAFT_20967 [Metschnikowia bicuspidata]